MVFFFFNCNELDLVRAIRQKDGGNSVEPSVILLFIDNPLLLKNRSEERRVGKECLE